MIEAKIGRDVDDHRLVAIGDVGSLASEVAYIAICVHQAMQDENEEAASMYKEMLLNILNSNDAWSFLGNKTDGCQVIDFEEMKRKMGR